MIVSFPPAMIMVLGAVAVPFLTSRARAVWLLALPALVLGLVWTVPDGPVLTARYLGYELVLVQGTKLGRLFATIFAIMAFAGSLFALNQRRLIELAASQLYAGSAVGVAMAGDVVTLFVFWELMAVGSSVIIWSARSPAAYRASMRYIMIHLLGGVLLMTGIIAHVADTGSIAFAPMQLLTPGTWMILIGFLVNAGAPPLSAWIPDAYPEASWSGTVFLSAFTTKAAVYVLIAGFAGAKILVFLGLYMIFYGIIYALLENDARRILAYSIVNQVGFMVTGVGIGTEMALNGSASHAFTHIIYKALLLMSAGSVLYMTGKRKCSDLGGLFQSMPVTTLCGIIGALAISSFPLTSGFISKSMISEAAVDQNLALVWFLLAAASAGVFLHAGIKFPWFVFFQKDSGLRPADPPWNMRWAMVFFAFLCIAIGVVPGPLYAILPFPVEYVPYTTAHVVNMLQLLLFAGLSFFLMLPMMERTLTISLDWDWFYRRLGARLVSALVDGVARLRDRLEALARRQLDRFLDLVLRYHGPNGVLARTLTAGDMVFWAIALLVVYLLIYFL
jgi:multicomponent Na+:H+ antiporter subunit D